MENLPQASKWFNILLARVPSDPGILSRMGHIANKEDDDSQAYFYHKERYVQLVYRDSCHQTEVLQERFGIWLCALSSEARQLPSLTSRD